MASPGDESALLIPVPEAEALVGEYRLRYDASAAAGVPSHITIVYPFIPPDRIDGGVIARLAESLSMFEPWSVDFRRVGDSTVSSGSIPSLRSRSGR